MWDFSPLFLENMVAFRSSVNGGYFELYGLSSDRLNGSLIEEHIELSPIETVI